MKVLRFILAVSLSLCLNACFARGLDVETIEQGQELTKAQEISLAKFVNLRMQNRPRKALVGNWEILYEDATTIYIGYPRFRDLLSGVREVEHLYRIDRKQLEQSFPGFRKITGNAVRLAMQQALQAQAQEGESVSVSWNWSATLKAQVLSVKGPAQFRLRDQSHQKFYEWRFSAQDLTLLQAPLEYEAEI